jgi:hypothetical protein
MGDMQQQAIAGQGLESGSLLAQCFFHPARPLLVRSLVTHRHLREATPPDFGVEVEPSHGMDGGQPDDPIALFFPWQALSRDSRLKVTLCY